MASLSHHTIRHPALPSANDMVEMLRPGHTCLQVVSKSLRTGLFWKQSYQRRNRSRHTRSIAGVLVKKWLMSHEVSSSKSEDTTVRTAASIAGQWDLGEILGVSISQHD